MSTCPAYCWMPNRGCKVICFMSESLSIGSNSKHCIRSSNPSRIFTENVTSGRECTSSNICAMRSGWGSIPLPLPAWVCMGNGHPILMSIRCHPMRWMLSQRMANSSRLLTMTCGTVGTPRLRSGSKSRFSFSRMRPCSTRAKGV